MYAQLDQMKMTKNDMTDISLMTYYPGIELKHNDKWIFISKKLMQKSK